jgi:hypothetical protein
MLVSLLFETTLVPESTFSSYVRIREVVSETVIYCDSVLLYLFSVGW